MSRSRIKNRRNLTIAFPESTLRRVEYLSKRWMVDKGDVIRIAVGEFVASDHGWPKSLPIITFPPEVMKELDHAKKDRGPRLTVDQLFR